MKKEIFIKDEETLKFLPAFIRRIFIKTYHNQGFIYVEGNNKPSFCSDKVRWLDKLKIETFSEKRADKLSWDFFHKKYPEYEDFVQLF